MESKVIFGTVVNDTVGALTVVVDGGTAAVPASAAKDYRPRYGDRVRLDWICGSYVIAYAVGPFIGTACACIGRTVDVSGAAGIVPMNLVTLNNSFPGVLGVGGLVRVTESGLFLFEAQALLTGDGPMRARIVAQDAAGGTVGAGAWAVADSGRTVNASALLKLNNGDGVGLWVDKAYTVSANALQLNCERK